MRTYRDRSPMLKGLRNDALCVPTETAAICLRNDALCVPTETAALCLRNDALCLPTETTALCLRDGALCEHTRPESYAKGKKPYAYMHLHNTQ